jgi:hypothetical protein
MPLILTWEAAAMARRKAIYEELHPEAKHGAASKDCKSQSFVSATSDAVGKDKSTISRAAARGEALGDDLNDIAGTSLDKGVELEALAKMDAPERRRIIDCAKAGENVSARVTKIDGDIRNRAALTNPLDDHPCSVAAFASLVGRLARLAVDLLAGTSAFWADVFPGAGRALVRIIVGGVMSERVLGLHGLAPLFMSNE